MLAEEIDVDGPVWVEDDDCGCLIAKVVIDGQAREIHHWLPDDSAPHVPDTECGCHPVLRNDAAGGVILFEHLDQDDPDDPELSGPAT